MKLTADTITDDQIQGLINALTVTPDGKPRIVEGQDHARLRWAHIALGTYPAGAQCSRYEARGMCAEILNARAVTK